MRFVEGLFVRGGELPVMGDALVVIVRHQVEDVFFEVRSRAADDVDLVPADHLRERAPELRRAHRPRESDHHLGAALELFLVGFGCIHHGGGIEVEIVPLHEL